LQVDGLVDHHSALERVSAYSRSCLLLTSTVCRASEFLDAIRSVNPPAKWKILVVDEHSQKLLNFVLKQFDILEENVTRTSFFLLQFILDIAGLQRLN
jgi:hypothetical protein